MSFNTSVPVSNALLTKAKTSGFAMFNGIVATNYYGDASDGSVTISADTNLVPPGITGSYDAEMIVKNYNNLTIDSGFTLTASQPCRGMLLYVQGDLVVNGTISMTARGAFRDPSDVDANGLQFQRLTESDTDATPTYGTSSSISGCGTLAEAAEANQPDINGAGKVYAIPKVGGAGGPGNTSGSTIANGTGGGGGSGASNPIFDVDGADGTCFSGGSGAGGSANASSIAPADYGGKGGTGVDGGGGGSREAGGGAGNPKGGSGSGGGGNGEDGTGGLLVIIVKGSITVGASGSIEANGKDGGSAGGFAGAGGSGSGGGVILMLHGGTYSNSGTVQANGGSGGSGTNVNGSNGGAGSIITDQISL